MSSHDSRGQPPYPVAMTPDEARTILGVPATAAPAEIAQRHNQLREEHELLMSQAASPDIRHRYERNLRDIDAAFALLSARSAAFTASTESGTYLPSPKPTTPRTLPSRDTPGDSTDFLPAPQPIRPAPPLARPSVSPEARPATPEPSTRRVSTPRSPAIPRVVTPTSRATARRVYILFALLVAMVVYVVMSNESENTHSPDDPGRLTTIDEPFSDANVIDRWAGLEGCRAEVRDGALRVQTEAADCTWGYGRTVLNVFGPHRTDLLELPANAYVETMVTLPPAAGGALPSICELRVSYSPAPGLPDSIVSMAILSVRADGQYAFNRIGDGTYFRPLAPARGPSHRLRIEAETTLVRASVDGQSTPPIQLFPANQEAREFMGTAPRTSSLSVVRSDSLRAALRQRWNEGHWRAELSCYAGVTASFDYFRAGPLHAEAPGQS